MTDKRPLQPNDLYRLRFNSDAQIAPDGSRIAFVLRSIDEEKDEYISNVYVVDREGTVAQFTSGDKDSAPRWSPDGRFLAFLSGRKEKAQVYLLPMAGGESTALTERTLGAGVPVWSPDGSALAFAGMVSTVPDEDERTGEKKEKKPAATKIVERASYKSDGVGYVGNRRSHLFVFDVGTRTLEQLTDGDFFDSDPAWSPDSRHLAFSSNRDERWDVSPAGDIYLIPRSGGAARRLTSGGAFGSPVFNPDGSRIAFAGHCDPDDTFAPARIYSVNRAGEDRRDETGTWDSSLGNEVLSDVVHSSEGHGTPFIWRQDGLYFLATERGESNVYRVAGGQVELFTRGRHAVTDFSLADDGTVAYVGSDATHLSEVYLWDGKEGKQLSHENDAFLAEVLIIEPERLSFNGANNEESEGWLLAPPGHASGKHPLIVYIHGGPQLAHGEALFFEYQFLAGQGFGVFYPNIHGSSSYGRDYQLAIKQAWGTLDYEDVLAGTDAASSRPWVDTSRLGIAGGSYGGYMTSWTLGHTDRFKAAVIERCLCNIISFMGTSDHGWVWNRQFGNYPEDDVQKLWDMSPLKYVAHIKTPALVMHSERDDRTSLEQGEQMFNALRRLGVETKLVIFPEESHGLSRMGKPSRRVERMGYILDWFKGHL